MTASTETFAELDFDGIALSPRGWTMPGDFAQCGDLGLSVMEDDPTSCFLWQVSRGPEPLATFALPWSLFSRDPLFELQDDLSRITDYTVPLVGLEPWLASVLPASDEANEEHAETLEQARLDWLKSRVGRIAAELLAETPEEIAWYVPGLIVPGWTTILAGLPKVAGKGTLACYLLAHLERAEATVFGPGPAEPVTALVVTEEPMESIREKLTSFGIERARIVYGYELSSLKRLEKFARVVAEACEDGHRVIFVDNVSRFVGVEDEGGVELARAVEPLSDACRASGIALLGDLHHKKGRDSVESKLRGGTGLPGAVEVILDIIRVGSAGSRKRKLFARGRVRATNWTRVIELEEDGTDYTEADEDGQENESTLLADVFALKTAGPVSAREFGALLGVSADHARVRLKALVEVGHALEKPGENLGARTGRAPNLYAVPPPVSEIAHEMPVS